MTETITESKKEAAAAQERVEEYKKAEVCVVHFEIIKLRTLYTHGTCKWVSFTQEEHKKKMETLEREKNGEIEKLKAEVAQSDAKQDKALASYKEQIRQHSVTICAMEERLNKVAKKNKDLQADAANYKSTISG